jgi:hypothetical protein
MYLLKEQKMQYRVTISYDALDKSGDAEGGGKTWKIKADNCRSAIEEALNNLEQRIKVRVAPTAELLEVKIDCKLMEDPKASYERIVQE